VSKLDSLWCFVRVSSWDFVDRPHYAAKKMIHETTRTNTKRGQRIDHRPNSSFDTLASLVGYCERKLKSAERTAARLMSLEVLHVAFMFLSSFAAVEGAEIAALARFWIFFARIKPVLS
jgi:hypothetical protein